MNGQPEISITQKRTSRLGIASLIIGIATPLLLVLFLVLGILLGTKKGTVGNAFGITFIVFGLLAPVLHMTGIILGSCGWISKKTYNFFR